jgi:hypothetical protein
MLAGAASTKHTAGPLRLNLLCIKSLRGTEHNHRPFPRIGKEQRLPRTLRQGSTYWTPRYDSLTHSVTQVTHLHNLSS